MTASENPRGGLAGQSEPTQPVNNQVDALIAEIEIWERVYDNPKKDDGTDKPNNYFGKFRVVDWIYGNMSEYDCLGIVERQGHIYALQGFEVSCADGGIRYKLTPVSGLVVKHPEAK